MAINVRLCIGCASFSLTGKFVLSQGWAVIPQGCRLLCHFLFFTSSSTGFRCSARLRLSQRSSLRLILGNRSGCWGRSGGSLIGSRRTVRVKNGAQRLGKGELSLFPRCIRRHWLTVYVSIVLCAFVGTSKCPSSGFLPLTRTSRLSNSRIWVSYGILRWRTSSPSGRRRLR